MSSLTAIRVGHVAARPRLALVPPCPPAPPRPAPALRLTRRGRLVVALALVALAVLTGMLAGAPAAAGGSGRAAVAERVTVAPGETLWQIAERVSPSADPRDTVARIQELNGLDSSTVAAGRALLVPTG